MTTRIEPPTPAAQLRAELARRKNHPAVLAAGLGSVLAQLDQFLVSYDELERAACAIPAVLGALARVALEADARLPGVIARADREGLAYLAAPTP